MKEKTNNKMWKRIGTLLCIYIFLACSFYYLGGKEIRTKEKFVELPAAEGTLPEISEGMKIQQDFISDLDLITKFTFNITTYGRANRGNLVINLIDNEKQEKLSELVMDSSLLQDNSLYEWVLEEPIDGALGHSYAITIGSECPPEEAPSIFINSEVINNTNLLINGEICNQTLCFSYAGRDNTWFGEHYWQLATAGLLILSIYLYWYFRRTRQGKNTILGTIYNVWNRYRFLIQQLVSRDFKTKYKRSVLGYLWSFLNPLLTMLVQYIVFSTIFKSDIKNFPVYLLSGTILFSFFTDSVGQGLSAIVNNSALITKVYVPKYIYPVTKVISTAINLMISIIPLLIVAIITGAPITKALLLLPFVLVCLVMFSIGLALALSAAMVFFRDTQYLWSIASLVWMYATPLFYPESIIPPEYKMIQKLNPMYYMIKFARTLLIDGTSPDIAMYGYCIGSALIMLVIGACIFKKTQDRFILYI